MTGKTLFDKIWDSHVVRAEADGTTLLYIDRQLVHEVTSPQAFEGLKLAGRRPRRPAATLAVPDHNVPTTDRRLGIADQVSALQIQTLEDNCKDFGITLFNMSDIRQGIVHVIGPEQGFTLPGTTIVCGDSHTSTHGAFGALAFGIGTSEVEHVLATQCLVQKRPKTMEIRVDGSLSHRCSAKDIILANNGKIGPSRGTRPRRGAGRERWAWGRESVPAGWSPAFGPPRRSRLFPQPESQARAHRHPADIRQSGGSRGVGDLEGAVELEHLQADRAPDAVGVRGHRGTLVRRPVEHRERVDHRQEGQLAAQGQARLGVALHARVDTVQREARRGAEGRVDRLVVARGREVAAEVQAREAHPREQVQVGLDELILGRQRGVARAELVLMVGHENPGADVDARQALGGPARRAASGGPYAPGAAAGSGEGHDRVRAAEGVLVAVVLRRHAGGHAEAEDRRVVAQPRRDRLVGSLREIRRVDIGLGAQRERPGVELTVNVGALVAVLAEGLPQAEVDRLGRRNGEKQRQQRGRAHEASVRDRTTVKL